MSADRTLLPPSGRLGALAWLAPAYVVHLTARPFRRHLGATAGVGFRARHSAASLDAWFGRVVSAYGRLARIRLRRSSGPLTVRYVRLAAALNREFEHRLATGRPLDFGELCAAPIVASVIEQWRHFTAAHGAGSEVTEFLSAADVIEDYDRYVAFTTTDGFAGDPALQMESIRLDSGGYLARLVRLVGSFNGRTTAPALLGQFHDLGVAAKLTDELTDLATDHLEGRYNLLLALLEQEPAEGTAVLARLDSSLPMPVAWWLQSAPVTFARFATLYRQHQCRLQAPELRRACDATMLRALGGPRRRRSAPSHHVSEPPQQAWR